MKRYIVIDLDGTLTRDEPALSYPDKRHNPEICAGLSAAQKAGFGSMVMTARGMRTYKGDKAAVAKHVRPVVMDWLAKHHIGAEQVHTGKPWCGPRGFYVDDRNLHLEEFAFLFNGPYAGVQFDVHLSEEAGDMSAVHQCVQRIERWLSVRNYRYPAHHGLVDKWINQKQAPSPWVLLAHPDADPAGFLSAHQSWFRTRSPETLVFHGTPLPDGGRTAPFAWGPAEIMTDLAGLLAAPPPGALVWGTP